MNDSAAASPSPALVGRFSASIVRALALLVVFAAVGTACGVIVGRFGSVTYVAKEQVLIQTWSVDSLVLSGQPSVLTTEDQADATTIATSQDVLERAAALLGESDLTSADLGRNVSAELSPTSHFITLQVNASSAEKASNRVQAVAKAFETVATAKVLSPAMRIAALPADQVSGNSTAQTIRSRAQLVVQTTQPVSLYPPEKAVKSGGGWAKAGAAGGIVGLAVCALIIIAFSFAPPKLIRAADVTRQLSLPGLDWLEGHGPTLSDGLAGDLVLQSNRGLVAVCPVSQAATSAAEAIELWLSSDSDPVAPDRGVPSPQVAGRRRPGPNSEPGVVLINPPSAGLASTRPAANLVRSLVLVATSGTATAEVERAIAALSHWRDVDAVIVAAAAQ